MRAKTLTFAMFLMCPAIGHAASLIGEWSPMMDQVRFVKFGTDGKLSGYGGCNRFFGSYKITGELLSIGPLASTRKMCPQDLMSKEQQFLKLLETTDRYLRSSHLKLRLFAEGGDRSTTFRLRDWD